MGVTSLLAIFLLCAVAGVFAARLVAPAQSLPLVAITNALGAIVILGGIVVASESADLPRWLGCAAIVLSAAAFCGHLPVIGRMRGLAETDGRG